MAFFIVSSLLAGALSDFSLGEAILQANVPSRNAALQCFYGEIRRLLIKLHNMREYTGIHAWIQPYYSIAKTLNILYCEWKLHSIYVTVVFLFPLFSQSHNQSPGSCQEWGEQAKSRDRLQSTAIRWPSSPRLRPWCSQSAPNLHCQGCRGKRHNIIAALRE